MAKKKEKLATPAWILEGYDSPAAYNEAKGIKDEKKGKSKTSTSSKQSEDSSTKGKTFKIRECPECNSDDVGVVLSGSDSEEGGGDGWECRKCKWKGSDINEKELTENELMKYMDEKGEKL
jgi:hypothetical protein